MKAAPSLIFTWRKPPTTLAVLGSFLVLSTLIHAMGFYVFHVVYQPAVSLPPSAAQITIVNPATPGAAPFLAWLDSEDPALTFLPDPIAPDLAALSPQYQSSISLLNAEQFSAPAPAPEREEPAAAVIRMIPQPIVQGAPRKSSLPHRAGDSEPRAARAEVRFDSLRSSEPIVLTTQEPNAAPAEFTMGIDRNGHVLFLLTERSTGSDLLDQQLSEQLRAAAFPNDPARPEIVWESARVSWQLGEAQ